MQDEVIAFLKSPRWHPGGGPVEMVQTHGALIFLAGDVALKIKRAVRYDYLDFSTLDLREVMLRRELELNKPTAPRIYHDVIPVTRMSDGSLALDGDGAPVEWVLRMWRFPKTDELAAIADAGGIDDALANKLGTAVFEYHAQNPQRDDDGERLIRGILDELDRVFVEMKEPLGSGLIDRFHHESRAMLKRVAALLRCRTEAGHVRRCHGDLHLRNLVLLDDKPVPFDALEFNEALGTCDVLYDLAFLIMDLLHRHQGRAANMVLNAYLLAALDSEDEGLATLPLFVAIRAAIRAMVSVQTATATGVAPSPDAAQFLNEAIAFLRPPTPSMVLIGGLSGTGKTAVSRALAPSVGRSPGAVHLRSDLERKVMFDVGEQERLSLEKYATETRNAVYLRMFERADRILAAGHSVLLDATFLDSAIRVEAGVIARKAGVTLQALWLKAPLPVLIDRVQARSGDASDADESVVRQQSKICKAPTDWHIVSTAGSLNDTITKAQTALHLTKNT
ncbi:kinase (plasmid) [Sulfitobacter sp. SK012]|uniref:bifunctional aminoglycoside phosphotransferase/ATP-binding protein n=1 Tax=Sulfitobacter sp. SK012 TaxID=1389005 RepID=UPI000E0B2C4F|nr:bifunctional aminoglycoside phosphotransferase/ATP-binding protein [Sulfitobacter sp. SK012]AXI49086.1 kinase [Sulfitobacter sp. SK012]